MGRRLFSESPGGLFSPLIDVVVNGLAAIFIILMIYMTFARVSERQQELKFLNGVALPPVTCGMPYIFSFPVVGGVGVRRFDIGGSELPKALRFNGDTGTIYGTVVNCAPVTGGGVKRVPLAVTVTDDSGSDRMTTDISVFPAAVPYSSERLPFTISRNAAMLPSARAGVPYEAVIGATGGVQPYSWSIRSGRLPAGLSLKEGRITGIAQQPGNFSFVAGVAYSPGVFSYKGSRYEWAGETKETKLLLTVLPPLMVTAEMPVGRVGERYQGMIVTNGRVGNERIEVAENPVPGILFDPISLAFSGMPETEGVFTVAYRVIREDQVLKEQKTKLRILPRQPKDSGLRMSMFLRADQPANNVLPYRRMVEPVEIATPNMLPPGLLIMDSRIVGTPQKAGSWKLPLVLRDALDKVVEAELHLLILPARRRLEIHAPAVIGLIVGQQSSWTARVVGGEGELRWEVSGSVPDGLQFLPTGTLSGSLDKPGEWLLTLRVLDTATGESATRAITLRAVYGEALPPRLAGAVLPAAIVGDAYDAWIAASGGVGGLTYEASGTLPDGIMVDASGQVFGRPVKAGTWRFNVTVSDSVGQRDGPLGVSLPVHHSEQSELLIKTADLPAAVEGQPYSLVFAAEGGLGTYRWIFAGTLPSGLRFTPNGIGGAVATGSADGNWRISAAVEDQAGRRDGPREYTLTARHDLPPLVIDPTPPKKGNVGKPYELTLDASGCITPCSWTARDLLAGFRLDGNRIIGVPQGSGRYQFGVSVTDGVGRRADLTKIIEIR